jgi:hypothetical protein
MKLTITIEPMPAEIDNITASKAKIAFDPHRRDRRRCILRRRRRDRRGSFHHGHLQRQCDQEMQRRVDETGGTPADVIDHESAEWPADSAGKTAKQREVRDRPARATAVEPAECGEHCVIKSGAHADANQRPGDQIERQVRRKAGAGKAYGIEQRTRQQHGAPAVAVDDAPHLRRDQTGDQQSDRCAADHPAQRPAGVRDNGCREHRREIERGPPRQDLRDTQRGDDNAAIELARFVLEQNAA